MVSRLRIKDERTILPYQLVQENYERYPDCNYSPAWRTSYTGSLVNYKIGKYSSMTDVTTPHFAKESRKGNIFMNPMTQVQRIAGPGGGVWPKVKMTTQGCTAPNQYYFEQRWSSGAGGMAKNLSGYQILENLDGSVNPLDGFIPNSVLSSCITEASTSALNARGRGDTNLYESLAELHKASKLLNDILGNALKAISAKKRLLQRAQDTGSAYLAYRYGLKPIMKDVESVVKGMSKAVGRVRQTSRGSSSYSDVKTTSGSWSGTPCVVTHNTKVTEVLTVRAMSLDEYTATFQSNIGFTDKGLITLPWELLPYSFVADWFLNIGDVVGAMVPVLGATQLGSCYVAERSVTSELTITGTTPNSGWSVTQSASGSDFCSSLHRFRVPGALLPGLAIRSDFRFDNLYRAADAIALIVQKLRK